MLINLFCILLRIYFLLIFVDVIFLSCTLFISQHKSNHLVVPKVTHYLCSILSSIMVVALYLNLKNFDNSIWWFYIIFGLAVIISIPLMLWVVFWKVEWTEQILSYRNLIGYKKIYNIDEIYLISRKQYTTIMHKEKKITDYNFMLLKISDVRNFEMFLKKNSKQVLK